MEAVKEAPTVAVETVETDPEITAHEDKHEIEDKPSFNVKKVRTTELNPLNSDT